MSALVARIRRLSGGGDDESHGHLFRSTHALMLTTVVNGALGFGFWILSARLYSAQLVGINSALIAIMTTIATMAQATVSVTFVRFLPESSRPRQLILVGYAAAASVAVVIATLLALIVPRVSGDLSVLRSHPGLAVVWAASVGLWCVFSLQDRALTALRFTRWVPVENGVFGVAKILVLIVLAALGIAQGILFAWLIPMALLVIPINWLVFGRAARAHRPVHERGVLESFGKRRLVRFLGFQGSAAVFDQGMQAAIPLLVVGILGATQNAYFYIPFTIVMTVEILIDGGVTALTVEGSFAAARLRELTMSLMRRLVFLVGPMVIGLIVLAPVVLLFFGRAYMEHSTTVLRLLAVAAILRGAIWVFVGVCRVQGRGGVIFLEAASTSVLAVLFIAVGAHRWGLNGVAWGWLAANVIVALAVLPLFYRFIRHPDVRMPESSAAAGTSDVAQIPASDRAGEARAAYYPPAVWGALAPPGGTLAAIDEDARYEELRRQSRRDVGPPSDALGDNPVD